MSIDIINLHNKVIKLYKENKKNLNLYEKELIELNNLLKTEIPITIREKIKNC